ncbi:MAG: response regulator, partial [SAR324 cluster bacterium]|nr:response regulator [SAR324 cluster bacterium]
MKNKLTILIVDDKAENLDLLESMLLTDLDVNIVAEQSGKKAIDATLKNEFALAILDVQMPEMSGFELAEQIRKEEKSKHLPIIFLSAVFKDEFNIFKGYESGAVDYMTKPYKREILINKVKVFLDLYSQQLDLQKSLKEKETLLHEIHHRVKNNMTVISSLLKLQMRNVTDEKAKEALQDSQNRVQTMSMIHETLYRSDNLSAIDMKRYLSDLGRVILQGYDINGKVKLNIEAESVIIGVDQACPLGLIVNELITNSLKYAFPNDRKGEIVLKLKLIKENKAELTYSDNGVGMPAGFDWRSTDSLGLKLVKTLVED